MNKSQKRFLQGISMGLAILGYIILWIYAGFEVFKIKSFGFPLFVFFIHVVAFYFYLGGKKDDKETNNPNPAQSKKD